MADIDLSSKRGGRKLLKKRREKSLSSVRLPERFRDGDDVNDDVAALKIQHASNMNQSVFSLIAAVGSKTNSHSRFEDDSSESEDEVEQGDARPGTEGRMPTREPLTEPLSGNKSAKHARKRSSPGLLQSLPNLKLRTKGKMTVSDGVTTPNEGSGSTSSASTPRHAPMMSRILEAQAQYDHSLNEEEPGVTDDAAQGDLPTQNSNVLAARLMQIFDLPKPEQVISEYPCWLLKSVLLQGYLYITTKHICFYAYLPKKSNTVIKSGHLSKRGRQNPKYTRYWFTLKGDVLSYFADPANLYFPSGNIDLRYGISATLSESKEKGKEPSGFSVVTQQRKYYFKADSPASAKEWVKMLQKVIFRSHNDGDSVKILIPFENVIDVEDSPVIEFADTVKIRVIDNDDTYAIDEYFFSFFSYGKDALELLQSLVGETPAQKISDSMYSPAGPEPDEPSTGALDAVEIQQGVFSPKSISPSRHGNVTPILHESVRATLAPISPVDSPRSSPRPSCDLSRASSDTNRPSLDLDRSRRMFRSTSAHSQTSARSIKQSRSRGRPNDRPPLPRPEGSLDSYVHSLDREPDSPSVIHSIDATPASASQILRGSEVFHSPTIQRLHQPEQPELLGRDPATARRHSEELGSRKTAYTEIRVEPPSRSQTQRNSRGGSQNRAARHMDKTHGGRLSQLEQSGSSATLQELVKAGAYPLQRAAGFAGYLKNHSKKMSNLLASESMGYIEKVSGMWTGARRHYKEPSGMAAGNQLDDPDEDEDALEYGDRFRAHFALPSTEKLQATFFGYLYRVLPLYGKIYISNRSFCFRSLLPGTRTKMILPLKDIENVDKEKGFRFGYSGLVVVIRGHEELFFEFGHVETRDDCAVTLLQNLETVRYLRESGVLSEEEKESAEAAKAEHQSLQEARKGVHSEHDLKLPKTADTAPHPAEQPPILFDDPRASIINFKPTESLRVTCLTIGSRGDVQPYIALCKGLLAEGHRPKIATHAEFEPWVRQHGLDFAPVDGDPAELMRICVENGMFTYSFMREASQKFRGWIDELMTTAWKACQDTDLLIESPSAMAGIHIAEALKIPYFRAFTMPWTRTRAYPHAFAVPEYKMGGAYNYFTYVMFDNVFWKAIAGQVNRWRKKELHLPRTNLDKLQPNKVPFLYNFSPSVVVPPLDYSDWIRVTGYWFLDEASNWTPPEELVNFIKKARRDDKRIVYVGFGSIVVSNPEALTRTVIESVLKADVRCILSKGWSDRLGSKDATTTEVPLPEEILQIKSAPHDWLFRQIDAAAHHGGAGTTGASLRAGVPTIIKPFFGDQYFFGSRVEDLGVGICIKKLNATVFSRALWEATHSDRMIVKARILGEQIRQEDGVGNAIQAIYRDMEYAKTLIKKRALLEQDDGQDESEESWTFIGDDSDPELVRRIMEWDRPHSPGLRGRHPGSSALGAAAQGVSPNALVPP